MKKYIATIEVKGRSFNANNIETVWMSVGNRKDAINRARQIARDSNARFVSVRMVKN